MTEKVLASSTLKECVIEVNDENGPLVIEKMKSYQFEKYDEYVHCDEANLYTADFFFRRVL